MFVDNKSEKSNPAHVVPTAGILLLSECPEEEGGGVAFPQERRFLLPCSAVSVDPISLPLFSR